MHKEIFIGNSSPCATQGLVVAVASSPEHQYEKLNYELMVDNNKKTPTDLKLNSLGRCCTIQRDELRGFTYLPTSDILFRACKLASTESLDDDGYLKNNDQRVADDAEVNDDDGHLKNNGRHVAEDEDVDNEGYLRNNDQRKLNPEVMGGYLKMTNSSMGDDGYQKMNGNSLGDNDQYLKMTGNSKRGSLQRAPTSL